jgi:hypothetical protein
MKIYMPFCLCIECNFVNIYWIKKVSDKKKIGAAVAQAV